MPNNGLRSGTQQSAWADYVPELREFSTTGAGITQPVIAAHATIPSGGRWIREPTGTVRARGSITFGTGTVFGSGGFVWGLRLPFPANRSSGGADLPIGEAWVWQNQVSNINMVLTPTLMDPLNPGGKGGQENYYAQFFCSKIRGNGTGSIASAATSTTITHGLPTTPTINDIRITPTGTTTSNCGIWYIDTITSTQFNVNTKAAPGASTFAFSWAAEVDPNGATEFDLLVSHLKPWTMAVGHTLSWSFVYEGLY